MPDSSGPFQVASERRGGVERDFHAVFVAGGRLNHVVRENAVDGRWWFLGGRGVDGWQLSAPCLRLHPGPVPRVTVMARASRDGQERIVCFDGAVNDGEPPSDQGLRHYTWWDRGMLTETETGAGPVAPTGDIAVLPWYDGELVFCPNGRSVDVFTHRMWAGGPSRHADQPPPAPVGVASVHALRSTYGPGNLELCARGTDGSVYFTSTAVSIEQRYTWAPWAKLTVAELVVLGRDIRANASLAFFQTTSGEGVGDFELLAPFNGGLHRYVRDNGPNGHAWRYVEEVPVRGGTPRGVTGLQGPYRGASEPHSNFEVLVRLRGADGADLGMPRFLWRSPSGGWVDGGSVQVHAFK